MLNLFRKPIEKEDFLAWSKMADDMGKVAIMTIPVILYGDSLATVKVLNITFLSVIIYGFLICGRLFRKNAK